MPKPLSLSKPFPQVEGISNDARTLGIISPAYASSTGELNATLQYVYHSFFFRKCNKPEIAEKLLSIAIAEMHHLDLLGQTILALGAPPVYCSNPYSMFNFYNTKFVAYSRSLREMIEDDILGERHAIASYSRMLAKLKNERVKEIISRISEDEKLHLETLEQILTELKG